MAVVATVGKTYYADDLYGNVVQRQQEYVQDKFLVKELINKTYADFDNYLVVRYKMSKPIKAPVHEYSKHTVNIGEGRYW
jgi:hypothetical protein